MEEQEKVKASNSEKYTVKERQGSCMQPSVADRQGSGGRSRRWRRCRGLFTHAVAAAKPFTGSIHWQKLKAALRPTRPRRRGHSCSLTHPAAWREPQRRCKSPQSG